jgi:hypothetical protein
MHPHFTVTFPSFHFTTHTHPSHPHHSLLPFPSDDCPYTFTSPYFITLLTLFLKLLDLQERVPKTSAGSWFQSWMVIFTKENGGEVVAAALGGDDKR